ncbi:MAG: ribosomal-processing cysteine protease Prp [Spirochaetota bacterium]|nr:ribosomal-processing cysteine protease Prp [Spirochaetota bacterium]
MIKVYLKNVVLEDGVIINKDNSEVGIKAYGHSGFDKKGSDIVCSAISAIIQTSILAVTKVANIHQEIVQGDGILESSIHIGEAGRTNLFALGVILNTMIIGLKEIINHYPDALEIIFE